MSTPNFQLPTSKANARTMGWKSRESAGCRTFTPLFDRLPLEVGSLEGAVMTEPSRREALAQNRVGDALFSRRAALDALAAQQPCADPAAAGELARHRAAVARRRARTAVRREIRRPRPRCAVDHRSVARSNPDRLITPNPQAFVRTECPAVVARHRGPWHDQDLRPASRRRVADGRRAAEVGAADGCAPVRVRRQQQPGELRLDERGGVGRRAAD